MSSQTNRTAGEIDWPPQFERTPASDRVRTRKFSVTFHDAIKEIEAELLNRVGAQDWRLSTAAPHRKRDGLPYADASPDDPGVVVRWSKDGNQFAVACDHYTDWRDNARAIGLYIAEKRKMAARPVTTGQSEFATARLPSADTEAVAAEPPAHRVLGVEPDADAAAVQAAYRERVQEVHPDKGGDAEALQRVRAARDALLNGNGGEA